MEDHWDHLVVLLCSLADRFREPSGENVDSNWVSDVQLVVGNSAAGKAYSIWSGQVYGLDFWDHRIPDEVAEGLSARTESRGLPTFATYDFSASPPFADLRHALPDLKQPPFRAAPADLPENTWNGKTWLVTNGPVSSLVADLRHTNQFAVRLRCAPDQVYGANGYIFSISRRDGLADMELRQESTGVLFSFRTPMSARRALNWHIPNVLATGRSTDMLFSYDGSNLSAFVDGVRWKGSYRLSPETWLASLIHHVKVPELDAYRYSFYLLVFFPAGCLLGLMSRRASLLVTVGLLVIGIAVPSVLLELILVHVGGQIIMWQNIVLACAMGLAGTIWINFGPRTLEKRF